MPKYITPGVYVDDVFTQPAPELRTGVPVFLGLVKKSDLKKISVEPKRVDMPGEGVWLVRFEVPSERAARTRRIRPASPVAQSFYLETGLELGEVASESDLSLVELEPDMYALWPSFEDTYASLFPYGYLGYAVRGFFRNGGRMCYVHVVCYDDGDTLERGVRATALDAMRAGLDNLRHFDDFDLVCVPDIMWSRQAASETDVLEVQQMQIAVLEHCLKQGDRFAILDALPGVEPTPDGVLQQKERLSAANRALTFGALYYPWIGVGNSPGLPARFCPPCGHVAGVYARSDERLSVNKAPANEILEGVLDLEVKLSDAQQGPLNDQGVNCLRVFPGRGIRVWGARTLSPIPFWRYVNVQRLILTVGRWCERNMADVVFEPHNDRLWARIRRELTTYLGGLLLQGALKGRTIEDAFYVKCDAEINPLEVRDQGIVIAEIGLATVAPAEFVVIRLVHSAAGVQIVGPS